MNRLVVVSNRVPAPSAAGAQAGGLAVALEALMQLRGGLWFGWSGRISDATDVQTIDSGSVRYATIDLTAEEHDRYYNEFANSTLWPLLHSMPELMTFDRRNAQAYRAVNERFAQQLSPMLREGDLLWIHDYHLLAMAAVLRERGVTVPIGFFLHIPFPAPDMLASVPESGTLVRDLLSADLLGFQTENDADNFAEAACRTAGAQRGTAGWLLLDGRRIRLGVFPVEIEPHEFAAAARDSWLATPAERLRRSVSGQAWTRPRACRSASPAIADCWRPGHNGTAASRCCRSPPNRARMSSPTRSCARRSRARAAASTAISASPIGPPYG